MSGSSSSSWTNQRSALLSRDSCGPITAHLVQELDIAVIAEHGDHGHRRAVHHGDHLSQSDHIIKTAADQSQLTLGLPELSPMLLSRSLGSLLVSTLAELLRSPNFMALMLREERMASLSAREGSSLEDTLADRMTHMSQRFTFTERRSALLRGEP